jgi:hypothetical protein
VIVPKAELAAVTREAVEAHEEWDSPHWFTGWCWDGEKLNPGLVACIVPDVHPDQYPSRVMKMVAKYLSDDGNPAPVAFMLQFEAFGVTMPAEGSMSGEEAEQFRRDRLGRTFHKRPDAVESCIAYCADVHGRVWYAAKVRGREDEGITENFYPPGRSPGGRFMKALLAVAYATGMAAHGLPGPQGGLN